MIRFVSRSAVGIFRSSDGLYVRDFALEAPPYEATREEWEQFLYPSGLFDLVEKRREIGVGDASKAKDK